MVRNWQLDGNLAASLTSLVRASPQRAGSWCAMTDTHRGGGSRSGVWGAVLLVCTLVAVPALSLLWPELTSEAVVGIDLGTTFSVVAVCVGGHVQVVEARPVFRPSLTAPGTHTTLETPTQVDGARSVPSVVSFNVPQPGRSVVGAAAAALRATRPHTTVHDTKRLIGRRFDDPVVQQEAQHLPYALVPAGPGNASVGLALPGVEGPPVTPQGVATTLLRVLKSAAERSRPVANALGFVFSSATVSVPVGFTRQQKAATLEAARAAGFRLVRLLDEPVAAAIAYGLHDSGGERTVVVYDMGGGTLDVAVLRLDKASRTFLVMATSGDAHLGGEDFDRAIAAWVRAHTAAPLAEDDHTTAELLVAVEAAKRRLSAENEAQVHLPGGATFTLTVDDAERAVTPLLERAIQPIDTALRSAGLGAGDIDDVVLVGGASQMRAVRRLVGAAFEGRTLHLGLDPDTAIAIGAARAYNC